MLPSFWLSLIHKEICAKTPAEIEADRAAYEEEWEKDVDYASTIHNYVAPPPMPQLDNFIYPLQLRTYFEVDASVSHLNDSRVVWIEADQNPQDVMNDVLAHTAATHHPTKPTYWYAD
eukprot:c5646_g1_i2.p2 GENE.c5646_g1_i2~~c5646_g1_i2.p2  ORF type:complete len:118 (-),score=20.66 c5646_g1_i2:241-594(-)